MYDDDDDDATYTVCTKYDEQTSRLEFLFIVEIRARETNKCFVDVWVRGVIFPSTALGLGHLVGIEDLKFDYSTIFFSR